MSTHQVTLCIAADHPALPGHFPARPIVPGVLLLDRVLDAAEQHLGRPLAVSGLQQVKFLSVLRPGEMALMELQFSTAQLGFQISRAAVVIAQGKFLLGVGQVRAERSS